MHSSLILRADVEGILPTAVMEVESFFFKPWQYRDGLEPPSRGTLAERIAWHNQHPEF